MVLRGKKPGFVTLEDFGANTPITVMSSLNTTLGRGEPLLSWGESAVAHHCIVTGLRWGVQVFSKVTISPFIVTVFCDEIF